MKMYLLIPVAVLALFSCSKPAEMQIQQKAGVAVRTALAGHTGTSLLSGAAVTDLYVNYIYSTGYGVATVHFTNNTASTELFTIQLKSSSSGSSLLGWQTVNVGAGSNISVSFDVPLITSGTLTATVMEDTNSFSASCGIYNATTSPANPTYRATALSSNPVLTLKYDYDPISMFRYYTPELVWTSFSNVNPNVPETIYAAIKYSPHNGSCLYPQSASNLVQNNKIIFNPVSDQDYLCKPSYVDYVWDRKPFNPDTVGTARWIRVDFPW